MNLCPKKLHAAHVLHRLKAITYSPRPAPEKHNITPALSSSPAHKAAGLQR